MWNFRTGHATVDEEPKAFFDVCQAIKSEYFPNDLGKRGTDPFSWLNWANRFIGLYVGLENGSNAPIAVVIFILKY